MVAEGKLEAGNVFHADEVLAKHDENYMPPEAADALKKAKAAKAADAAQPSNAAHLPLFRNQIISERFSMIPEIGNFAFIVALFLSIVQGVLPIYRCGTQQYGIDGHCAPIGGRAVRVRRDGVRLLWSMPFCTTIFPCCMSRNIPIRNCRCSTALPRYGAVTKVRCCCGRSSCRSGRLPSPTFSRHLPQEMVARVIGRDGFDLGRLPAVHAADLQSVRSPVACRDGRPGSESAAAGSRAW